MVNIKRLLYFIKKQTLRIRHILSEKNPNNSSSLPGEFNSQSKELEPLLNRGLTIGENSHLFSASSIDAGWPWLITIGDNVTISSNVTILAHDASPNIVKCGTKLGKVVIGNNVFIGTGAIILCNTFIGNNVIIGAGSVVSGTIEANGVYCGVPAKKVYDIKDYHYKMNLMRNERPDLSKIRPWNEWKNASEEERQIMSNSLNDGCGFI